MDVKSTRSKVVTDEAASIRTCDKPLVCWEYKELAELEQISGEFGLYTILIDQFLNHGGKA
ncbi:hypothetical protein Z949_303 [Sulfitobacter guttiformis KCTC 32187]|nr:hypothetical protein Z949_303 [Sulfitobacter guttiformis KCTC 32187]